MQGYLSGRETSSTGDVREFTTSNWTTAPSENYTVRVVTNVDGREENRKKRSRWSADKIAI